MDIRRQLLVKHSRDNADIVERHVSENKNAIIELMACFFSDETVVAQRAAQVVGNLGRHQPESLRPWWDEMVSAAEQPVHVAIRRNVARYFCELEIGLPESIERRAAKSFTSWSTDATAPVAVAVFAMQFVADRSQKYPKLAKAVRQAIKSRIESASPGFQNRGRKILQQLSQMAE